VTASPLDQRIDGLWARRAEVTSDDVDARDVVTAAVDALDAGEARVAWPDPGTGEIVVDERAKRAILLAFRLLPMERSTAGDFRYHDRVPLKTRFDGVRVVPGAIVRWGAYVAPGTVLMPSFVNIGAYVDTGTMVDTWATVGSCAQIGKNVHISGGAGIGGVLEPPNAVPVVVEDDAFVGSRSMVVEGARVRTGAKLGSGTMLTATPGRSASAAPGSAASPAATSACRACWSSGGWPREPSTTGLRSTRSCVTTGCPVDAVPAEGDDPLEPPLTASPGTAWLVANHG
jgi:2,3,4,5-tetrahydropyridine-2-carboxylate N-succinyltransferase